jgi:hypothetical protein
MLVFPALEQSDGVICRDRTKRLQIVLKARIATAVLVGNLRSEILVVQSAQNRHRQRETDSLDGTRHRRVLVQR